MGAIRSFRFGLLIIWDLISRARIRQRWCESDGDDLIRVKNSAIAARIVERVQSRVHRRYKRARDYTFIPLFKN